MTQTEKKTQIYYFPYLLKAKEILNSKQQTESEGILIKWQDAEGAVSYSDLPILKSFFPGLTIDSCLDQLKNVQFSFNSGEFHYSNNANESELILAQWQMAQMFYKVQSEPNLKFPFENNFLMTTSEPISKENFEKLFQQGIRIIKLKMKSSFEENLKLLMDLTTTVGFDLFKWRLDFNSSMDEDLVVGLIEAISPDLFPYFEYIEDPCLYDLTTWTHLNSIIPVAIDFEINNFLKQEEPLQLPFKYLILKPSIQNFIKYQDLVKRNLLTVVVTSSMQGPLGVGQDVLFANYLIEKGMNVDKTVGCGTLSLFENLNPFDELNTVSKLKINSFHSTWDNSFVKPLVQSMSQKLNELKWINL